MDSDTDMDSSTRLPDDPIDDAELGGSRIRPSAGEEALIASGAEVVGDSEISEADDDLDEDYLDDDRRDEPDER